MRGATSRQPACRLLLHFNPRSSCEERQQKAKNKEDATNFNPRSSCEERPPFSETPGTTSQSFQSTLLMRGATITLPSPPPKNPTEFQSTLLMRGATARRCSCRPVPRFQSTLLMRGATCYHLPHPVSRFVISIHTPHARSDQQVKKADFDLSIFQSTLLMRGATQAGSEIIAAVLISIHAPHARSDYCSRPYP